MVRALVYQKLSGKKVRCLVCQRKCAIPDQRTGFCLTKINKAGELFSINYGVSQGIQVDPIEKKPFYHFHPGEPVPSLGSYGCNFHCRQCLNWWCSWGEPATSILKSIKNEDQIVIDPEKLIKKIRAEGYSGIAFTYNEPVVWAEYVLDLAKAAKRNGLFTVFVTNGSWTPETLEKIGSYIDAANIDFKGFSEKTYRSQGGFFGAIPQMAKMAQNKYDIFIEVTTVLIPGVNDNPKELEKMTDWIVKNLGRQTPWHLSRYSPESAPDKNFAKIPPTSVEALKKAASIGRKNGLEFVYVWAPAFATSTSLGASAGKPSNSEDKFYSEGDTYCPSCKNLAVKRYGWKPDLSGVDRHGCCLDCGYDLNIKRG